MAYRVEPTENGGQDLVIDGWEKGIASSPLEGIANMQNGNISTQPGEILANFNRTLQSQLASVSGTLTPTSTSTVSFGGANVLAGSWIHITADSGTGLSGDYYYLGSGKLSSQFDYTTGHQITGIHIGTLVTTFLTSGTTYSVPADWNNSDNTVECIGGGGGGGGNDASLAGSGGGAGAYSKAVNVTLTPSGSATYAVGAAGLGVSGTTGGTGGDTYFNGASLGASSVGAKGGVGGIRGGNNSPGGVGGASGSGVGSTKYSGGNGGTNGTSANGGGGAGAAGPNGAGNNGSNSGGSGGAGGQGDVTFGGVGGTPSGGNGGNGTEFDGSHGSGGGGAGGIGSGPQVGGNGGNYGAGGGGSANGGTQAGGNGTQGLIRIQYYSTTPTTSATFTVYSMGKPVQKATEPYYDSSGNQQYRYYILDSTGYIWVHDSNSSAFTVTAPLWFRPQTTFSIGSGIASGLGILNGFVIWSTGTSSFNSLLTSTLAAGTGSWIQPITNTFHATLVGHQGKYYYTDGNFIGSMFPNTSLLTGAANVQSYCSYTAVTTTGTASLIGGTYPYIPNTTTRIPVFFYTDGTLPSAITANTIYYIKWLNSTTTFEVYAASSGGSAINIQSGSVGNQYFNTFNPINSTGASTATYTPQRLNLPFAETAQCIAEIGNQVLIGCNSNTIYPWNQVSTLPQDFVVLPESNVTNILTVNNMGYAFVGQKGNIYITNGSTASFFLKVPDYCAGIAGTPASYIEPYFTWGDGIYMKGRVWFSILDQTATKTGNCGGIWSCIPNPDNPCLRLENQSSYGTYNGVATVLLQNQVQSANGPQYWSGWYSSVSNPLYGIDYSDTVPVTIVTIESDLIPTGTLLSKKTFGQVEYKLSSPLASGESIAIKYRVNSTDAFTSLGSAIVESATDLAGYFQTSFQKTQWLQLQTVETVLGSSSSSFGRLKELRLR